MAVAGVGGNAPALGSATAAAAEQEEERRAAVAEVVVEVLRRWEGLLPAMKSLSE